MKKYKFETKTGKKKNSLAYFIWHFYFSSIIFISILKFVFYSEKEIIDSTSNVLGELDGYN